MVRVNSENKSYNRNDKNKREECNKYHQSINRFS